MTARPRARDHRPSVRPTPSRPANRLATLLVAGALLVAACANPVLAPGGSSPPGTGQGPAPADPLHRQAHDALERWADAVHESGGAGITFVGDRTGRIGEWEPDRAGNPAAALLSGLVEAGTALSAEVPGRGSVRWLDGTSVEVNVLSAAMALQELVGAGDGTECRGCLPLRITEAKLATSLAETSRGPAEAPTWVFTIEGSAVRVTRLAVDQSVTVKVPPWNADHPPEGVSIIHATGEPDSRRLTVQFVGAELGADEPCGADYTAEAVESELAVVVIVTERRDDPDEPCDAVGFPRTAEVRLASRLGDRAVLEVRQGLPVEVSPS